MKKAIFLGVFMTLLVPLTTFAAFDANLKYGSKGSAVIELQEFLTAQGVYSGPITGNFYALTMAGVKAFQTKEDISPISGYFGPLSRAKAVTLVDLTASDEDEQTQTGTITPPVTVETPLITGQTQTTATVSTPVVPVDTTPVVIDKIQPVSFFNKTNEGVSFPLFSTPEGKRYITLGYPWGNKITLKDGTKVTLTMDSGNIYQLDTENKFWITELDFNPTWIYAGTHKERTWKIEFSYDDPINGVITGSITDKVNINDLKDPSLN